jgi:hypothetical protein
MIIAENVKTVILDVVKQLMYPVTLWYDSTFLALGRKKMALECVKYSMV